MLVEKFHWWDLSEEYKDYVLHGAKTDGVTLKLPSRPDIRPNNNLVYSITRSPEPKKEIIFIADSGAFNHMVGESVILSNFKKSTKNEFIICANQDESADIKIDGRGDLNLFSRRDNNKPIKLSNVISASDLRENLMSLRLFAEAGIGIWQDDKELKICYKDTNDVYLTGYYSKPYWLISLSIESG